MVWGWGGEEAGGRVEQEKCPNAEAYRGSWNQLKKLIGDAAVRDI